LKQTGSFVQLAAESGNSQSDPFAGIKGEHSKDQKRTWLALVRYGAN
jgi:hypothetical protein